MDNLRKDELIYLAAFFFVFIAVIGLTVFLVGIIGDWAYLFTAFCGFFIFELTSLVWYTLNK